MVVKHETIQVKKSNQEVKKAAKVVGMEVEGVECLLFYLEVNKKMKPKNS